MNLIGIESIPTAFDLILIMERNISEESTLLKENPSERVTCLYDEEVVDAEGVEEK